MVATPIVFRVSWGCVKTLWLYKMKGVITALKISSRIVRHEERMKL